MPRVSQASPSLSTSRTYFRPAYRVPGQVAVPDAIWETPGRLPVGRKRIPRGTVVGLFAGFCCVSHKHRSGWVSASQMASYMRTWAEHPNLSESEIHAVLEHFVRWGFAESRKRGAS